MESKHESSRGEGKDDDTDNSQGQQRQLTEREQMHVELKEELIRLPEALFRKVLLFL